MTALQDDADVWPTRHLVETVDVDPVTLYRFWPGDGRGSRRWWTREERCVVALAGALIGHRFELGQGGSEFRRWVLGELAPIVAHQWMLRRWRWLGFEFPSRERWFADTVDEAIAARRLPATTLVHLPTVLGPVAP